MATAIDNNTDLDGASIINKPVIIVGGSVAGLALALSLERAGINYLLLERGEFAPQLGASIVTSGCALRIFDQLGILPAFAATAGELSSAVMQREDGTVLTQGNIPALITEKTGYPMGILERKELLDVMYGGIHDKSKCLAHSGVTSYEEDDDGVTVLCDNGASYRGAMIVGADGVHSRIRKLMVGKIEDSTQKQRVEDINKKMSAHFTCVFGMARDVGDSIKPGCSFNIEGQGRSMLLFAGKDGKLFFFLFERIPEAFGDDIPRFTQEEAAQAMEAVAHIRVNKELTVDDVNKHTVYRVKVALEEHLHKYVYYGRVCLLGDALHKMTPNDGFGGIMAIESAACLANAIYSHISLSPLSTPLSNPPPEYKELTGELVRGIFKEISCPKRMKRWNSMIKNSAISTRMQAGNNVIYRTVRRLVPYLPHNALATLVAKRHMEGVLLSYLPKPTYKATLKYDDEKKEKKQKV